MYNNKHRTELKLIVLSFVRYFILIDCIYFKQTTTYIFLDYFSAIQSSIVLILLDHKKKCSNMYLLFFCWMKMQLNCEKNGYKLIIQSIVHPSCIAQLMLNHIN